jgi:hypothetical protein
LTSSQQATVAVEILPRLEEEARKRQIALAGTRPSRDADLSQLVDTGSNGRATDQAAEIVGTNRQYVHDAKQIRELRRKSVIDDSYKFLQKTDWLTS